jgi:hypothetical protein
MQEVTSEQKKNARITAVILFVIVAIIFFGFIYLTGKH